jgi:hypothetical protein
VKKGHAWAHETGTQRNWETGTQQNSETAKRGTGNQLESGISMKTAKRQGLAAQWSGAGNGRYKLMAQGKRQETEPGVQKHGDTVTFEQVTRGAPGNYRGANV